jgi:hypothetical protein
MLQWIYCKKMKQDLISAKNVTHVQKKQISSLADWGFMEFNEDIPIEISKLSASVGGLGTNDDIMKGAKDDVNKVERSSSKTRGQEEESSNDTIAPTAEVATKKNINAPVLPTRYSSRVKKDGIPMMEKAMNRKAAMASTGISSHPNSNNTVANQVELISKVCGINLGDDIKIELLIFPLSKLEMKLWRI